MKTYAFKWYRQKLFSKRSEFNEIWYTDKHKYKECYDCFTFLKKMK